MFSSKVDVPVALFFFNRPEQLKQVFCAVRKARPSKLFLFQDGPRENSVEDEKKILACRMIVEEIDWDCHVFKNYNEINLGCGKSVSSGISLAFEQVDRLIILEDDTVPSISCFEYWRILLERYKDDQRIGMISGMNNIGEYNRPEADYFFSTAGSIWGWATWKRVWENYDYDVSFASNKYYIEMLSKIIYPTYLSKSLLKEIEHLNYLALKGIKRTSWSGPFGFATYLNSQLNIVPKKNMVTNIGLSADATNGGISKFLIPYKLQSVFNARKYEISFPLSHPKYIIEDRIYNDLLRVVMDGGKNPFNRFLRKMESRLRNMVFKIFKFFKITLQ